MDFLRRIRLALSRSTEEKDPHAKIRKAITDLPRDNPRTCEGRIRQLYKRKIEVLEDAKEKENLLDELRAVACYGLSEDLRNMMKKNGLAEEFGLELVMQYKTTLPELAKYFYNSNEDSGEQIMMAVIRERIGQEIEVLGGLKAKGVDVEQIWVKKLCKEATSFRSLLALSFEPFEEAKKEDIAIVSELCSDAQAAKGTEIQCNEKMAIIIIMTMMVIMISNI